MPGSREILSAKDRVVVIAGATVGNYEYKGAILGYNHFWIMSNFRQSDRGAPIPEGTAPQNHEVILWDWSCRNPSDFYRASGGNTATLSFC